MNIDFGTHAYLVRTSGMGGVISALKEKGIETKGNPDCMVHECDELSVEDARAISLFAYYKPVGERKFVIVRAGSMTAGAQNALLKIVEEGRGSTVFFFVIAPGISVLPTLESRCVVIKEPHTEGDTESAGALFLAMTHKERLVLAEKFAKDSDRNGARDLVRSLLRLSSEKKFPAPVLRDLLEADNYLKLSGSSPKSIIGHLALVL